MKKIIVILVLCAVQLLSVGAADALTISQTLYTPALRAAGSSPPVNSTLGFNQFNTTLANGHVGILNSVLISVDGQVLADFVIKNTSAIASNISSNISGDLLLRLAGVDLVTLSSGSWVNTAKNGLAAGATWTANNKLSGTASDSTTLTNSSWLSLFTGSGLVNLFAYTNLMVSTGISGGTDYVNSTQAWAREGITITYDYTDGGNPPVPEPGTILLLGSGVLAFGAAQFRRRSPRFRRRRTKL